MDMLRFAGMVPRRREIFANAPATPLPTTYKVNITAKALHPGKQFVKIAAIDAHADDLKTFKFVADGVKTKKLATFRSGQYITITANVGDSRVTRAYTLASSPLDALEKGFYTVTIKGVGILSDYMCAQAKVGDVLEISEPSGDFCYEPLRDRKHIVAVAGGVGITSLLSMAKSVYEGTEDCTMTFFYCVASKHELLFTDELDAMNGDKIKVVYVVEKGDAEGCEKGLMSADLVKSMSTNRSLSLCAARTACTNLSKKNLHHSISASKTFTLLPTAFRTERSKRKRRTTSRWLCAKTSTPFLAATTKLCLWQWKEREYTPRPNAARAVAVSAAVSW